MAVKTLGEMFGKGFGRSIIGGKKKGTFAKKRRKSCKKK